MGTKRDRREREQNCVPAEHRYVEGGISMMDLERIYIISCLTSITPHYLEEEGIWRKESDLSQDEI